MVNYKLVYLKLKERYPEIAKELVPDQPPMHALEMLEAFTIFCKVKGIRSLSIPEGRTEMRDLFLAVLIKLYDPEYLLHKKKLRKGLRPKMASLLRSQESIISYNLTNVKNYLMIYKDFREEVDNIYCRIKSNLNEEQGTESKEAAKTKGSERYLHS